MQESGEMYLETILVLSRKLSTVRSIDVATHMGFSKPSVSRAIGILKRDGYVETDREGHLLLTKTGKQTASRIYERHVVLTDVLMHLGVDDETAAEDACRIEHYISDKTFQAIKKYRREKMKDA